MGHPTVYDVNAVLETVALDVALFAPTLSASLEVALFAFQGAIGQQKCFAAPQFSGLAVAKVVNGLSI